MLVGLVGEKILGIICHTGKKFKAIPSNLYYLQRITTGTLEIEQIKLKGSFTQLDLVWFNESWFKHLCRTPSTTFSWIFFS